MTQDNHPHITPREAAAVDYNTQRHVLVMPEYGRCVQEMVEYAKTLPDREQRLHCAEYIISVMATMARQQATAADLRQKLWNHLAAIANYELDIDYPITVERLEDNKATHEPVPYPQQNISRRHYGAITAALAQQLATMEPSPMRDELTRMVANQMKRNLARWNKDAMNDERVFSDLADLTDGHISVLPSEMHLTPDSEILKDVQLMAPTKKKKKH